MNKINCVGIPSESVVGKSEATRTEPIRCTCGSGFHWTHVAPERASVALREARRIIEKIGTTGVEDTITIKAAELWLKSYPER